MARSFNGSTDVIDCSNSNTLAPASISFSGWIRSASWTNAYNCVISRFQDAGSYYQFFVKSNGKLAFYTARGGSASFYDGTGSALSVDTWYQIGFTYGAGGGGGYINGVADGSTADFGLLIGNTGNTFIGKDANTAGRFLPVSGLADCAVWNVVLTPPEILALGRGARPTTIRRASLIGYWPLDGLASPEPDFSGNALNGTLTGTAAASGPPITLLTQRSPAFLAEIITAAAATGFAAFSTPQLDGRTVTQMIGY